MAEYLGQLSDLQKANKGCPILCAGDVFDRWNSPPELINFAIKHLPAMYAVPGQHDLPLHSYADIRKSAYWTLVEAGKITNLKPHVVRPMTHNQFWVVGFPWGHELKGVSDLTDYAAKAVTKVALVHSYCWIEGKNFPGAPENKTAREQMARLKGFDIGVFGDNHKGFFVDMPDGRTAWNCGGFMRRKSDELDYAPAVGLLYPGKVTKRHLLDTSKDKFHVKHSTPDVNEKTPSYLAFKAALTSMAEISLDFAEVVHQSLERFDQGLEIDPDVKKKVEEILEAAKEAKKS